MWIWASNSGVLFLQHGPTPQNTCLDIVERSYAGYGVGRNDPSYQDVANVGPIPVGMYTIQSPRDTEKHGPFVLPLLPDPKNRMYQRAGFLIHGDNATHDASKGCIILSRQAREQIWQSNDRRLRVVDM